MSEPVLLRSSVVKLRDNAYQPTAHDPALVQRYAGNLDRLPPMEMTGEPMQRTASIGSRSRKKSASPQTEAVDSPSILTDADGIAHLMDVSVATVHRMRSAGRLPRPIRVSAGCVRWRRATIEEWLAESERAGRLLDQREWDSLTQQKGMR